MIDIVRSRAGVPIRLTDERWEHIVAEHDDLVDRRADVLMAVGQADRVVMGREGELLALWAVEKPKTLVVAYRERSPSDGFVITAFLTSRPVRYESRQIVWPAQQ